MRVFALRKIEKKHYIALYFRICAIRSLQNDFWSEKNEPVTHFRVNWLYVNNNSRFWQNGNWTGVDYCGCSLCVLWCQAVSPVS